MALEENSSPEPSDDTSVTSTDEILPASPSISISSASSPSSSSSLSISDISDADSEPIIAPARKKWTRREPAWPAADEIALLEAVLEHREAPGQLPTPDQLSAALRGRIESEHRRSLKQISSRLNKLRDRYEHAARKISRGTVPVADDDLKIYRLSKRIWEGAPPRVRRARRRTIAREDPREFRELAVMYPCLAKQVEVIGAKSQSVSTGALKRAFEHIGDDTAARLEAKVRKFKVAKLKAKLELESLRGQVWTTILNI